MSCGACQGAWLRAGPGAAAAAPSQESGCCLCCRFCRVVARHRPLQQRQLVLRSSPGEATRPPPTPQLACPHPPLSARAPALTCHHVALRLQTPHAQSTGRHRGAGLPCTVTGNKRTWAPRPAAREAGSSPPPPHGGPGEQRETVTLTSRTSFQRAALKVLFVSTASVWKIHK